MDGVPRGGEAKKKQKQHKQGAASLDYSLILLAKEVRML
jgi:hypothetical protein